MVRLGTLTFYLELTVLRLKNSLKQKLCKLIKKPKSNFLNRLHCQKLNFAVFKNDCPNSLDRKYFEQQCWQLFICFGCLSAKWSPLLTAYMQSGRRYDQPGPSALGALV